ncbi:MAG: glycosyltransferase family 2 protein [Fimbriimonadaceae bacterium]|nr:glycosyltransferase family 2 protein [Fimbriimonadaceae bacterium]
MDLTVVIVNWNTREDLRRCLASLEAARAALQFDVVVVDNGSRDGSVTMVRRCFPAVQVRVAPRNGGFAYGNNLALRTLPAGDVLLLNPDCVVHPGALTALTEYAAAHPEVGLLGPRLLNGDGSLQASCRQFPTLGALLFRSTILERWFPRNRWARAYLMQDWDHAAPRAVDWLSGACLWVRRATLQQIGLLDERFYMYCEDIDWCRRATSAGWRVVYYPTAVVTHLIGRSSDARPLAMVWEHHRSMLRYVGKHHGALLAALALPWVTLRLLGVNWRLKRRP